MKLFQSVGVGDQMGPDAENPDLVVVEKKFARFEQAEKWCYLYRRTKFFGADVNVVMGFGTVFLSPTAAKRKIESGTAGFSVPRI